MKPRTKLLKEYFEIDNLTPYKLRINEKLREKTYKKMIEMYSKEYETTNKFFQKNMLTLNEFTRKLNYEYTFFRILDWYKKSIKDNILVLIYKIDEDEIREKYLKKKSKAKTEFREKFMKKKSKAKRKSK